MPDPSICPTCGQELPEGFQASQALLTFTALRENDTQELFRITADRRMVFAPDIEPREVAETFALAVTELLQRYQAPAADLAPPASPL